MKKLKIVSIFLFSFLSLGTFLAFMPAGKTYITHTGHVWFFSKTKMENIEAHNHQVASNLNTSTGDMAYSILIKSFEFKKALMQDHFNENYLESDKYPKSTFKGRITNLSDVNFDKNGTYNVTVSGDLTMHNVTKPVTAKGTIIVKSDMVNAKSTFMVELKDYAIKVPGINKGTVAESIAVNIDIDYPKN